VPRLLEPHVTACEGGSDEAEVDWLMLGTSAKLVTARKVLCLNKERELTSCLTAGSTNRQERQELTRMIGIE
jgi:hypothetical protein